MLLLSFVLFSLAPVCLCLVGCSARLGMFEVITVTLQETEQNILVRMII